MAITPFGYVCVPADAGTLTGEVARSITPPASMLAGDLVRVLVQMRMSGTISNSVTGGQTWTAETQRTVSGSGQARVFWCRFNGTWDADPAFDNTQHAVQAFTIEMCVARPSVGTYLWAVDVAESYNNSGAPVSPYNMTKTGQTPLTASTITFVSYLLPIDILLSAAPAGWTNPSATAQMRNFGGTNQVQATIFKIQTSIAATGNATVQQASGTGNGWAGLIQTFKEVVTGVAPEINAMAVQSVSEVAYTSISLTPSAAATLKAVAVKEGDPVPSKAQIKLGQNSTGAAAFAATSQAVTGATTYPLGGSLTRPCHDIHALLTNANGDGAIVSLTEQLLAAPPGYQYKILDLSGGTPTESLAYGASPAAASEDVGVVSLTTPESGCVVTLEANGVPYLTGATPATPRQSVFWRFFDGSLDAWSDTSYVQSVFNNQGPTLEMEDLQLQLNVPMTPINLRTKSTDPEGDLVDITATGLPPGTAIVDSVWAGTPNVLGQYSCVFHPDDPWGDGVTYTTVMALVITLTSLEIPDLSFPLGTDPIELPLSGYFLGATSYSISSGSLPFGWSLNETTGLLTIQTDNLESIELVMRGYGGLSVVTSNVFKITIHPVDTLTEFDLDSAVVVT